jgi:hypothetical protein
MEHVYVYAHSRGQEGQDNQERYNSLFSVLVSQAAIFPEKTGRGLFSAGGLFSGYISSG